MLNQCILIGNLGDDPEIFYSEKGTTVASFPLAFQSNKDKTCWIKTVAFGNLGDVVEKYLNKGSRIAVAGTLDQDKWETDEGEKRSSFQLIAHNIEFIKTKKEPNDEAF